MNEKKIGPDELVAYFAGFLDGKKGIILDDDTLRTFRNVAEALYFAGYDSAFNNLQAAKSDTVGQVPAKDAKEPILCPCPECSDDGEWVPLEDDELEDFLDFLDFLADYEENEEDGDDFSGGVPVTIRRM